MPSTTPYVALAVARITSALLLAAACSERPTPTGPTPPGPNFDIADAARAYKAGFYWLPPVVKQPSYAGTFDAELAPTVEICELVNGGCGPTIATYTTTDGPGGEVVRLDLDEQHYHVNWHTNEFSLDVAKYYRVSVRAGANGTLLGYADVQPVSSGSGLKKVDSDEYIGLVDGRTLPIKFRIETGVVGSVEVQPIEAEVESGATQQFVAILRDLHGAAMTGDVTWASSDEAVATVNQSGLATAVADGVATITATSDHVSGSATLTVVEGGIAVVGSGGDHSCVLTAAGRAYCWGRGDLGQLGNGSTLNQSTPVAVSNGLAFAAVEPGQHHTCAITVAGQAHCWGHNSLGQLGNGAGANSVCQINQPCQLMPVAVATDLTFSSISAGFFHSCGIASTGRAYCWGHNGPEGKLGNGSATLSRTPQPVFGDLTFASISAGTNHACGVTMTGKGYCWGSGADGRLGTGSTTNSTTPAPVFGDLTFVSIQAGNAHSCGVTTAGKAYCWGEGSGGRLGNGSNFDRSMPWPVSGTLVFASTTLGLSHTCGLTTEGLAYCWGAGGQGQLGGTPPGASRLIPAPVAGGFTFVSLAAGALHTCGVTTEGEAYCWGIGSSGQIGNGTTPFAQLAPALVGPLPPGE